MGLLQGSKVYLIGSVDHAKNPRAWRNEIREELLAPLGVKVYDPLVKPSWFNDQFPQLGDDPSTDFVEFKALLRGEIPKSTVESTVEFAIGNTFKTRIARDVEGLIKKRMNAVRDLCLRMAHDADFIIGSIPKKFTVGTLEELGVATASKKPILLLLPDGMDTSTWLPAQIPSFFENSFLRMDDLYDRVRSIDAGNTHVNNLEWMFLSYFNDEEVKNEFTSNRSIGIESA